MLMRLVFSMLLFSTVSAHALWEWLSPEQYFQKSTLIAILNVGEIHQAWTPENILIESATATVGKVVYYQFAADEKLSPVEKLPETIIVYNMVPNAMILNGHGYPATDGVVPLAKGRFFPMLREQGFNKFVPFDRFSFQKLDSNKIMWPAEVGKTDLFSVDSVISDLERLKRTMKPKP